MIKDLKKTDEEFNTFPVVAFTLDVPEELTAALTKLSADYTNGGTIVLETYARVKDKPDWVELQGDFTIKTGEIRIALQNLAQEEGNVSKDTPIELRCTYRCSQGNTDDFWSDYSEIITFNSDEMAVKSEAEVSGNETADESKVQSSAEASVQESSAAPAAADSVSSFPVWIIIIIAVVLIIIIIIIIVIVSKNKKKNN